MICDADPIRVVIWQLDGFENSTCRLRCSWRGEFNLGQISNATSLPRSQIESRIVELVPDRRIPIVVYDEGEGRAALAAHTLGEFGYEHVSILDGGLPEWRKEKLPSVSGVNVPSKAFGEKVHHERTIPESRLGNLEACSSARPIWLSSM